MKQLTFRLLASVIILLVLDSGFNANADSQTIVAAGSQPSTRTHEVQLPDGWRRTKDGWEHTSTWSNLFAFGADLNELIAVQRDRQPAWVRASFARLRSIPPLMIALLQITAIAVIVNVDQNIRRRSSYVAGGDSAESNRKS